MANNPQTSKDRTEQDLVSAIEEALNLRDFDSGPAKRPATSAAGAPVPPPIASVSVPAPSQPSASNGGGAQRAARMPRIDEPLFDAADAAPGVDERVRQAANDDRESIGQLLRALQQRPSSRPYVYAWVFAVVWLAITCGLAFGTFGSAIAGLLGQGVMVSVPLVLGLLAVFLGPVAFVFVLANMLTRSQELRLVGQSMAEIAIRLAEPETLASNSIVNVSQAVRREVAAMGDGVERALARAAELEGLVNSEVATLERAYTENEVRIRGLLDSIASQRDTLVNHAAQVRDAISSVHVDLSSEIGAISAMMSKQVNEAAAHVTETLTDKGQEITRGLETSANGMITMLGERGADLLERLEQASESTSRSIEAAAERMTTSLSFKDHHIEEEFIGIANNIQSVMRDRLDQVADEFSQKSISVLDTMDQHSRTITDALLETSSNLTDTIANRVDDVNNTLKATGRFACSRSQPARQRHRRQARTDRIDHCGHADFERRAGVGRVPGTCQQSGERDCQPQRHDARSAHRAPGGVRSDLYAQRRRARGAHCARFRNARRPHHSQSHRVRPHLEDLRRRTWSSASGSVPRM